MKPIRLDDTAIDKILADVKEQLLSNRNYKSTTIKISTSSEKITDRPIIDFDAMAWLQIKTLVEICSTECAWQGTVEASEDRKRFTIHDILCYPQTISGATVVTDETLYEAWHQALDNETYNTLKLQGHSHVNFSATPSATDTTMYDNMLQTINNESFYIFMIINKSGAHWFEIHDIKNNVIYENKDIDILVDDIDLASWYKEQATNFSKQTSTLHNGIYNHSIFDAKSFKDAQTIQGFDDEPPYGYSEDQFKDPFYADDGNKFLRNAAPEKQKRGRPRKEK